jgi:hypothetical protein
VTPDALRAIRAVCRGAADLPARLTVEHRDDNGSPAA